MFNIILFLLVNINVEPVLVAIQIEAATSLAAKKKTGFLNLKDSHTTA